ncbi:TPA: hypothetical protein DIC20_00790 [Candidatus Dependentiae bacterium]|nr:MAG: hypothetical protein US03_C0015G0001 [candidate division TM6 bacterium GW2011_GWF2_36_131]KKQ02836.1 MAG: hypothetical protein US13_C0009G0028 [candidate division TM6 bacterium GW2011_GWE2_36_25]KKQ18255.1 MAG: hypothetical protein US32_C0028G0012 [candidate division TM6 bacterium GW2011_GWA2_36_9]HBR71015.1 hypothetical protein [Candidatus Dependentiae bacterium]HCU00223.1 hypothetical protein [Candidatus Dependentiae bacterium]
MNKISLTLLLGSFFSLSLYAEVPNGSSSDKDGASLASVPESQVSEQINSIASGAVLPTSSSVIKDLGDWCTYIKEKSIEYKKQWDALSPWKQQVLCVITGFGLGYLHKRSVKVVVKKPGTYVIDMLKGTVSEK